MTLLNSKPLIVDKSLATILGLNEALILQQLHYWIEINKKNKRNFHEDKYWTYNTIEEWQAEFPFWSISTVKRTFKKLRDMKIIIVGNFNAYQMDRTLWYTINYEELSLLSQSDQVIRSEGDVDCSQDDTMEDASLTSAIPESTTEISSEITNQSINHDGMMERYESIICNCELYAIDESYRDAVAHAIRLLLLDIENSNGIQIGNNFIPACLVEKDLDRLNFFVIEHAVNQFKEASGRHEIRNPVAYLKVCIYNSINEMKINLDSRVRFGEVNYSVQVES